MPTVKSIDNRGTVMVPFGFVYVDDTRVGFSQSDGVWSTYNWVSTSEQRRAANDYLDVHLPGWDMIQEDD